MSEPYWEPLGGVGFAGALTRLDQAILAADAPSINLNVGPGSYRNLMVLWNGAHAGGTPDYVYTRFNNDAAALYDGQQFSAMAATLGGAESSAQTALWTGYGYGGAAGQAKIAGEITIFNPQSPEYKSAIAKAMGDWSGGTNGAGGRRVWDFSILWRKTDPITSIQMFMAGGANLRAGFTATLYGLSDLAIPVMPGSVSVPLVVGLPASPYDGMEVILTDSLTAPTYAWRMRYCAGIADAYKWVCLGGTPKLVRVETDYPANAILSTNVPNAGYYNLGNGATIYDANQDTIFACYLTVSGAGNYAYWNFRAVGTMPGYMGSGYGEHPGVLCAAGAPIVQGMNPTTSARIERRFISAMPVRLS